MPQLSRRCCDNSPAFPIPLHRIRSPRKIITAKDSNGGGSARSLAIVGRQA